MDAACEILKIPDPIEGQWDNGTSTITIFAFEVQAAEELPEDAWNDLENASEVLYNFYLYFKSRRRRLLYRRKLVKDIKAFPTSEDTEAL